MNVVVLADEDTVTGFRMAGVAGHVCDVESARAKLKELSEAKIIITTEKIGLEIRKDLKTEGPYPILVEVPDKKGPLSREVDPISELLRKAVGVEVKLK